MRRRMSRMHMIKMMKSMRMRMRRMRMRSRMRMKMTRRRRRKMRMRIKMRMSEMRCNPGARWNRTAKGPKTAPGRLIRSH